MKVNAVWLAAGLCLACGPEPVVEVTDTYAANRAGDGLLCGAQCTEGSNGGVVYLNVDYALEASCVTVNVETGEQLCEFLCTQAETLYCNRGDRCALGEVGECEVDT